MKLGERVKACREAAGWSQVELAKRAGVSQQLIGRLESGEVLETRKLQQIALAFNMSLDEFLSDSEPPMTPKAFGKLIREKRTAQGMTQLQLADRIGVTKAAVSHWELGRVEGINPVHLHWLSQILRLSDKELRLFHKRPALTFPELPPFPQSEMEVIHLYAALPENVRRHVRGIIEALAQDDPSLRSKVAIDNFIRGGHEQEISNGGSAGGVRGCIQAGSDESAFRSSSDEGERSANARGSREQACSIDGSAGRDERLGTEERRENDAAWPRTDGARLDESISKLGAADHLKAGPAEALVIAGSAPATGQSITVDDAPKLSMRNRDALLATDTASCYLCVRTFLASSVKHWTDGQRTALCPTCGVDSVIPGSVPAELLGAMCQRWFIPQPGDEL